MKTPYWTVAIENVLIVAIFAAVAIVFHKWWIVLFSLLFASTITHKTVTLGAGNSGKEEEDAD